MKVSPLLQTMKMKNKMFKIKNNEELLLLSKASGKSKEWLLAHPEYKNFWALLKYKYYLHKLKKGIPTAYILGHKEFFNLDFLVNRHTLIPRPDTEILVDEAIKEITNIQYSIFNILFIDVGTGTGCIPISILQRLNKLSSRDLQGRGDHTVGLLCYARNDTANIIAIATDISKGALKIAKKNAKKYKINIRFFCGNLLSPIFKSLQFLQSLESLQSIVITANLPYLKEEWWKNEPSIQHEPKSALVSDNETGLNIYKQLLSQIVNLKSKIKNQKLIIFLEIDPRQSSQIFGLIQKHLPAANVEIIKDLSGFDRVVKIELLN